MRRRTFVMRKIEICCKVEVFHHLHSTGSGRYRIDQDILTVRPQWVYEFSDGLSAYRHWSKLKGVEEQFVEMPEDWPGADLRRR